MAKCLFYHQSLFTIWENIYSKELKRTVYCNNIKPKNLYGIVVCYLIDNVKGILLSAIQVESIVRNAAQR